MLCPGLAGSPQTSPHGYPGACSLPQSGRGAGRGGGLAALWLGERCAKIARRMLTAR
ncbi:MAG TPA: hypothetical protein VHT52_18690 [Stellaceae bacterium]|nr:hypothetical protein [Stellaceae bacterium]